MHTSLVFEPKQPYMMYRIYIKSCKRLLVLCETERNGTKRNEGHHIGEIKKSNLNSKKQYNHNSKLREPCIIIVEWCIMSDETHNTQNIKYEPCF